MHKRYTQEQHFDHRRDLAKHDFPPLDQRPVTEEERAEAAAYEAAVAYYEQYFGSGK